MHDSSLVVSSYFREVEPTKGRGNPSFASFYYKIAGWTTTGLLACFGIA